MRRYPKLLLLLEYDGEAPVGGRTYNPALPDPSEAGAQASTLWEICLTKQYYHPHVAQASQSLMALRASAGSGVQLAGPLGTPHTTDELARMYDSSRGGLRPTPPAPKTAPSGGNARRVSLAAIAASAGLHDGLREEVARMVAEGDAEAEDLHGGVMLTSRASTSAQGGEPGSKEGQEEDGAGGYENMGDSEVLASEGLRRMFLGARRHELNSELRREKVLLVEKLKRFQIHLQQRAVEQAKKQAAALVHKQPAQAAHAQAVHGKAAAAKIGSRR